MENIVPGRLEGWEIHGFRTMEDLDFGNILEEAKARWLRPNEIHAMLCNYKCFNVAVKPVNLPKSGTIVWFDRKMLRNFRKDGHNWKKKKDGKTVKEAHEHLKVGNEERIHVYYAHGEDIPTFVRRCYWLLDKTLEHIVLVHYRETQELQGSPVTPVYSNSNSGLSDPSASWILSEETESGSDPAYYTAGKVQLEPGDNLSFRNHEMTLHEINTLEWEELLVPNDPKLSAPEQGKTSCFEQQNEFGTNGFPSNVTILSGNKLPTKDSFGSLSEAVTQSNYISNFLRKDPQLVTVSTGDSSDILGKDALQTQDSFGKWMNYIMTDTPESLDDSNVESSNSTGHGSSLSPMMDHLQSPVSGQIFSITDVSPAWAFSTEETKILITGYFNEGPPHLEKSNIYCVCGDACCPVEIVQSGVFRCLVSPHTHGYVNLYLSFDDRIPISQVLTFEYRIPLMCDPIISVDDKSKWEEFRVQMRLAHLLFSSSKSLQVLSSKVLPKALKEAKIFARKTSHIADGWAYMIEVIENNNISFQQAKDNLFEITLKNRLYEWLLERVVEGCKTSDYDDQGQGVIHLCAILDYRWAVLPFAWSGLSLDYRDKHGWTALHWAAYCGREKMVAALLSAGAKPNLVTDPNSENPGGCIAADLASKCGYDGLAAYLAEKALVEHFKDMTIAGNVSGSLQTASPELVDPRTLNEEELFLKDTLAAYRTAADAAARIQAAFREQSFKLRTKAVEASSPEDEVRNIIAAMKIQHAFRKFETRKKMAAAARIQHRFRAWKIRREFLNMKRQTIKIQAVFRGLQVRRQYRKIVWSVGVLEKAILRWRLKRRGFRGLQVSPDEAVVIDPKQESDVEDFFRASRNQAEERVERSVVRVQALFRSKRAQQEYQRMKLAYNEAMLEYDGIVTSDDDM
ncbi:Calmodulin-binding transcription activator 5 like [Actinidia chinensis var. chinensis]|uniref:Calmodulin-binding transcription activator 5 like n=1 Tax=Actinidia chinensis var. chinensis TaxID=1590841 RepID=A0A2R6PJM4_ACTCC|nr:Calmodulin-binding transcription activator 5 like [Actinidia chinensis var. chinensis]